MPSKRKGGKATEHVVGGLHSLPDDVLHQILIQLDTGNRLTLGNTCKRLYSAVAEPSDLWRVVEFKAGLELSATPTKAQWFLAWLMNKAKAVENLAFNFTSQEDTAPAVLEAHASRVWPHIYAAILLCHSSLAELKLNWKGPCVLGPWLAKGFPALKSVEVGAGSVSLEEGLQQVRVLESLSVEGGPALVASLPLSLTRLVLCGCGLTAIPAALSALEKLEELALSNNMIGTSSFAAFSSLGSLRVLELDGCGLSSLPAEASCLTRLENLYLDDNPNITVEQLEGLSHLTRLEVLALPNCKLPALPAAVTTLERLRMLFCHGNTLTAIPSASSWLGRLSVLSIGLRDMVLCTSELEHAESLVTLYISRSNDPIELQCSGLLDVLTGLAALESVFYIRPSLAAGRKMTESFEFGQLLHALQSTSGCKVAYIGANEIAWGLA